MTSQLMSPFRHSSCHVRPTVTHKAIQEATTRTTYQVPYDVHDNTTSTVQQLLWYKQNKISPHTGAIGLPVLTPHGGVTDPTLSKGDRLAPSLENTPGGGKQHTVRATASTLAVRTKTAEYNYPRSPLGAWKFQISAAANREKH